MTRTARRVFGLLLAWACFASCARPDLPDVSLAFVGGSSPRRQATLAELAEHARVRVVETDDPYYGHRKRFRAIPIEPALAFAFGEDTASLRRASFVLHAGDGYAVRVAGSRLLEGGAHLAFEDLDVPGFEPIGPRSVSPAPFYLVWTRDDQRDLETHPRPWQLVSVELTPLERVYAHVVPGGEPEDGPAMRGYTVFVERCIRCHAINREGGRVGPDLNVPRSIVEYRPDAQIREYIRDPSAFRYGAMPSHPDLGDDALDALLAYFRAMAERKHDPDARGRP